MYFIQAIAIESPKANWADVEDVGTIFSGPASFIIGMWNPKSEFLYNTESFFEVTPINLIFLFLDAYWIIFFNSSLSPLLLIKITISFVEICPKSPWLAFNASKKKAGVPVEEKVAAHFLAIIPLFPTPEIINFPFKFSILFTALKKSSLRLFAKSFIAFDSIVKTSFADLRICNLFIVYLWAKISVFSHPIKSSSTLVSKKFIIDLKVLSLFVSISFASKFFFKSLK